MNLRDEDALEYHAAAPAGKIAIRATKPCLTQRDLSLAYTPGVAVPCLAIERDHKIHVAIAMYVHRRCRSHRAGAGPSRLR